MQLPLEVLTEDGYRFQLNVEGTHYVTGDMSFPVSDVKFDESTNPIRGWFGDKETGVGFNVTIPMPEDKAMFHWERIPGQLLRDDEYFSLSSDGSYESLGDCLLLGEVRDALNQDESDSLVTGIFEDGSRLKVLTWVVPLDNYNQHLYLGAVVSRPYTAVQVVGARQYFYIKRQDNEGYWQTVSTWTSLDDAIASVLSWRLSSNVTEKIIQHHLEKDSSIKGYIHVSIHDLELNYRSHWWCFGELMQLLQEMAKVEQMPDEEEPTSGWFALDVGKPEYLPVVLKFTSELELSKLPRIDDSNQLLAAIASEVKEKLGEEI